MECDCLVAAQLIVVLLDDGKARRNAEFVPAVAFRLKLVLLVRRRLLADEGQVPYSNHLSIGRADFGMNIELIPHLLVELNSADRCCSQQYPCGHLRGGMRRSAEVLGWYIRARERDRERKG